MANATILSHLGLFVRHGFLDADTCRRIRAEMTAAERVPAMIRPQGAPGGVLDEGTRRTAVATMAPETIAVLEARLRAVQPALEQHFALRTTGWQRLQFYIYEPGSFFAPHRDKDADDPMAPDWVKARQVSVSILLNDAAGANGERYDGGSLMFYGHRGDRPGTGFTIPLDGEAGMFIAFPSDWIHEVKPVTAGRRFTIVTWFC